jgi:hypothetical protein
VKRIFVALVLVLHGYAEGAPAAQSAQDVKAADWLSGCWQVTANGSVIDEHWMASRGGVMLGMSRTVRADRVSAFEFVTIRVVDGRLVYEARPSGQMPATFAATSVAANRVVFENPQHDYPKRITYVRAGDALTASIDDGTGAKRVDYPYRRVSCP